MCGGKGTVTTYNFRYNDQSEYYTGKLLHNKLKILVKSGAYWFIGTLIQLHSEVRHVHKINSESTKSNIFLRMACTSAFYILTRYWPHYYIFSAGCYDDSRW